MDLMNYGVKKMIFFTIMLLVSLPTQSPAASDNDCLNCHEKNKKIRLSKSAHTKVRCQQCHTDASTDHPEKLKKVQCKNCHGKEVTEFVTSDHGKALGEFYKSTALKLCSKCHEAHGHDILGSKNKASRIYRGNIAKTCASCHETKEVMVQYPNQVNPYKSYQKTIHGKSFAEGNLEAATCSDCHGSHANQFRLNPESKMAIQNISKTCGKCHEAEYEEYAKSKHAKSAEKGVLDAPLCITCHGEHNIYSVSEKGALAYKSSISRSCAVCHESEKISKKFNLPLDRISTYSNSYHGAMNRYGDLQVAQCASCHGAHAILPATDPESKINPKNLPKTCGLCHPGSGPNLKMGKVHVDPKYASQGPVFWVRLIYLSLIFGTIGFMLLHNLLDFRKKVFNSFTKANKEGKHVRLNRLEKIQHHLLAWSFIGLAWTGFAIAYPESVTAFPFRLIKGGGELRWWLHRILAGIMVFTSFMHIYYAVFTNKGRKEVPHFLPKLQDLKDLLNMLAYNLDLKKERPTFGSHSYIEKAEYLALVWGTIVMVVTGTILMLQNLSLAYLPLDLINVATAIHMYEAILAGLAIIVWHFYFVMFDPDEYPMNWTWITGTLTPHQLEVRNGRKKVSHD